MLVTHTHKEDVLLKAESHGIDRPAHGPIVSWMKVALELGVPSRGWDYYTTALPNLAIDQSNPTVIGQTLPLNTVTQKLALTRPENIFLCLFLCMQTSGLRNLIPCNFSTNLSLIEFSVTESKITSVFIVYLSQDPNIQICR